MSTDDGYDWNDGDTVLHEQPRTAVCLNADGAILIKQQNWPEADDTVILQPQNAIRFVLAVLAAAGCDDIELVRSFGGGGYEDVKLDEPPRRRHEPSIIDRVRRDRPDINIDVALADFDAVMAPKDLAPPVAKSIRAAEAVKANPNRSNRAIAAELGIDEGTVRKARPADSAPERTGQDGKSYPIRQRVTEDVPPLPELELNGGGNSALAH
jgi:hypothetical protein